MEYRRVSREEVREELKRQRKYCELSLHGVAAQLGVDKSHVHRCENTTKGITFDSFFDYAELVGLELYIKR